MARRKHVTLHSLLGEHWLDAVDYGTGKHKEWDGKFVDANLITVRLDGICYTAIEDPNDGYRSSMDTIFTKEVEMTNVFTPTWVVGRPYVSDPEDKYSDHRDEEGEVNLIEFVDVWNGKVILTIGTDFSDGYYPSFVANWAPENLAINEGK